MADQVNRPTQQRPPLPVELQATLNIIPAYTWYAMPSGALTFVNQRCADYLGLPSDHPLRSGIETGATWDSHLAFLHPEDHEDSRKVWSNCLSKGSAGGGYFRLRSASGAYRWFQSSLEPLRANDGTLLYWVGINLDIEDLKQAELQREQLTEQLQQSEAYLAEAQRLSRTGSWAWSPGTDVPRYWSEECYRVLGFDPRDGVPRIEEFVERVHPDDQPAFREFVKRARLQKLDEELNYRIVHPGGGVRNIQSIGHPVFSPGGDLIEFTGTVMDITERKRAEEELRASERKYQERKIAEEKIREQEAELRQILDLTPQAIGVLGPDGSPLYLNHALHEYYGVAMAQWSRFDFVHPEDREDFLRVRESRFLKGQPHEWEGRLLMHDGTYRWFLVRRNPLKDAGGQITRWYVTATDIEDRKRAEEEVRKENIALREEIIKASMFEEIVGNSPALQQVLMRVAKVAPTDSTVLICGETGTGKELIARAIHRASKRANRAFVSVNCAAIPSTLIPSELFGHEKGAFTGANQRRLGRFELAEGGTIFLDEIGELPAETQVALLRVLQEREFERVGGNRSIRANVRVIVATNRDLQAAIAAGKFREDLFYRLNVFPIEIPPLRERKEDIPMLVQYLIDRYARKEGKNIRYVNKRTLDLFQSYPWPGNVRELQNVIERSVIVSGSERFSVDESWLSSQPKAKSNQFGFRESLNAQEKEAIEAALRESRGRVFGPTGAAAKLGMARSTLENRIRTLKIDKNRFKVSNPS